MKAKSIRINQTTCFVCFISFKKFLIVTLPLFWYLVTQNFQRYCDSKQQIVLGTNLSELLTLNKYLKGFLQCILKSFCNITIMLQN